MTARNLFDALDVLNACAPSSTCPATVDFLAALVATCDEVANSDRAFTRNYCALTAARMHRSGLDEDTLADLLFAASTAVASQFESQGVGAVADVVHRLAEFERNTWAMLRRPDVVAS